MAGLKPTQADVGLGARLAKARCAARLPQRKVAVAVGVSAAQLQKYEKGTNRISAIQLAAIADVTRRPIAWFFQTGAAADPTDVDGKAMPS